MKRLFGIISILSVSGLLIFSSRISANSCDSTGAHQGHKDHSGHQMNMQQHDHSKMQSKDESIVRNGVIDVKAIDKNKDGKVFQDQMDWNVISDKPGKCPLCKMTLQEVSIKKAQENLKANGFKVKSF